MNNDARVRLRRCPKRFGSMLNSFVVSVVSVTLGVLLPGCSSTSSGFPKRSTNEHDEITALESLFASSSVITQYFDEGTTPVAKRREERDKIVNGRMSLIDANYRVFVRQFVVQKQTADTATDIAVIGVNSAAALITPSGTTQLLAAIAAGITGAKASFDKNFYYEQTVKALYAAMEAQRAKVRLRILSGLRQEVTQYPLSQALTDLEDLYSAGTFLGALQSIQTDASVKSVEAQQEIDDIRGLGDTVVSDRDRAREIIALDLGLARSRLLAWYQQLTGDAEQLAARTAIMAVRENISEDVNTDGLPDPVKWLGGDASLSEAKRATVDELAAYVAGLNNPISSAPQSFKGELIRILLGN